MKYTFGDLKNKVAVITGSGRGIGKAISKVFIEQGAKVVVNDVDADVAEKSASELAEKGGEVLPIVCDITDKSQVDAMFQKIVEKWGKVDILVNNAGITIDTLFLRMKPEQWKKVMDINLTGSFYCSKAAVEFMRKVRSGNIINISSIAALGNVGQVNYSASKAGIIGFTRSLSKELAPMGIRVNCVAPGFIETRLTDAIPDKIQEKIINDIPQKKKGEPKDIANAILFLASDLSEYITGEILNVNGGITGL